MKYRVTITEVETGNAIVDEEHEVVFLVGADGKGIRKTLMSKGNKPTLTAGVLYHAQNVISETMIEFPELEKIFELYGELEAKNAAEAETKKETEQE